MTRHALPIAVLLAVLPATVRSQAPAGSEFRVNTSTEGEELSPSVATDENGNFVVVWTGRYGLFGQRFSAAGAPLGGEFQLNPFETTASNLPAVASDKNGNFVVVWQNLGLEGSSYGVFGQRFDAVGNPLGGEFHVNTYTTGIQALPQVASDPNGNFVVVWNSYGQDGSHYGVFGRRYNAAGQPQGGEFAVNQTTIGPEVFPSVAKAANGDFVVVWANLGTGLNPERGIFGRQFDVSGAPVGAEFHINEDTVSAVREPRVASDPAGNFVVVWSGPDGGGGPYDLGVFGRRFDASAAPQGGEFRVNTYTTDHQEQAVVASDEDGNFVVVWNSTSQEGDYPFRGVFGQRYDASGTPVGGEFHVNTYTTDNQRRPAVARSPDGDFVVVWHSRYQDGHGYGVFGQRYGDIIFEDGFESGGLTHWSSASTDGGDLSVSGAAAMAGTGLGLQAVVDDTNSLFVQDDTPSAENRYNARFYFDPNGFDPGEAQSHFRVRIFIALDPSGLRVLTLVLKRQAGAYDLEARVRRNDGTRVDTGFFPITDAPHFFEVDWQRATGPGASDGSLQLRIDGALMTTLSGIDNDQSPIDFARMGMLSVKTGAGGTAFYDQFESRREVVIGPE